MKKIQIAFGLLTVTYMCGTFCYIRSYRKLSADYQDLGARYLKLTADYKDSVDSFVALGHELHRQRAEWARDQK